MNLQTLPVLKKIVLDENVSALIDLMEDVMQQETIQKKRQKHFNCSDTDTTHSKALRECGLSGGSSGLDFGFALTYSIS